MTDLILVDSLRSCLDPEMVVISGITIDCLKVGEKEPVATEALTMLVVIRARTDKHF